MVGWGMGEQAGLSGVLCFVRIVTLKLFLLARGMLYRNQYSR